MAIRPTSLWKRFHEQYGIKVAHRSRNEQGPGAETQHARVQPGPECAALWVQSAAPQLVTWHGSLVGLLARRLRLALDNLLGNAALHGALTAPSTSNSPRTWTVRITVADDGPGIPPDQRQAMRELHSRRPNTPPGTVSPSSTSRQASTHQGALHLGQSPAGGIPSCSSPRLTNPLHEGRGEYRLGRFEMALSPKARPRGSLPGCRGQMHTATVCPTSGPAMPAWPAGWPAWVQALRWARPHGAQCSGLPPRMPGCLDGQRGSLSVPPCRAGLAASARPGPSCDLLSHDGPSDGSV
ncbi:ATP-binding protein [Streptomyces sp. NBC_00009]|uniref:ATP-binding protein n=1 Tax=Streptomyces sp. NBC_00009 TaxID=2975620 RepID=UPI00386437FA